jgi:hypothetical protein
MKMKTDCESEDRIAIELEKICGEWGIYAKQIERPRPQHLGYNSKGPIRLLKH